MYYSTAREYPLSLITKGRNPLSGRIIESVPCPLFSDLYLLPSAADPVN